MGELLVLPMEVKLCFDPEHHLPKDKIKFICSILPLQFIAEIRRSDLVKQGFSTWECNSPFNCNQSILVWLDHSDAPPGTCMDGKAPAQQGDVYLCTFILGQVTGSSGLPDFTCHTGKISLKVELGGISLSSHAVSPELLQAPVSLPMGLTIQHRAGPKELVSVWNSKLGQGKSHTWTRIFLNGQSFDLWNPLPLEREDKVKFSMDLWNRFLTTCHWLWVQCTHLSGGNNEIYDKGICPFLRECARNENKSAWETLQQNAFGYKKQNQDAQEKRFCKSINKQNQAQ